MSNGVILRWVGDHSESWTVDFEDEDFGSFVSSLPPAEKSWDIGDPLHSFFGRGETETQGRDHEVTQDILDTFQSLLEDARLKRQIDQSEMTPGTINDYANARDRLIDFVQRAIWPGEDE